MPLEHLPKSTAASQSAMTVVASKFLTSNIVDNITSVPATTMSTTRGNCAAVSKVEPPARGNCAAVSKAEPPEEGPPELVDESDDEDWRRRGEILSNCSSADTEDNFQFLLSHYEADGGKSDDESSEDRTTIGPQNESKSPCAVCALPKWRRGNNPKLHHCRNYCRHRSVPSDEFSHQDAPFLKEQASVTPSVPLLCSPLLPPEVAEILASAVKPINRKKLKRQAKLAEQSQKGEIPLLAAMSHAVETSSHVSTSPPHREKVEPAGDVMNPLIAWYSLVAKPIPRKMWASMPKAQAAVDAEWEKLRQADGGRGTWDESTVCNYWDAQRQAKEKLERTGVHTHFGSLFDLCVEKSSELEEAKRRYKGRVVFGGHRIHDEFVLAAEFPEQGLRSQHDQCFQAL